MTDVARVVRRFIQLIDLNLLPYSRRDLSNILQFAQQCDNAGYPLPCQVVEQLIEAHDALLGTHLQPPFTRADGYQQYSVGKNAKCVLCGKMRPVFARLECGALVCERCYN